MATPPSRQRPHPAAAEESGPHSSIPPREFQVFVKPVGAACNLACGYCYYLEKRSLYAEARMRMPDDVLERYIVQHIAASAGPELEFSWHGGEPTLLGVEYFRRIVALQRRHLPAGWRLLNGIQTNATLLDRDWCRFLSQEGFRVGVSIDGPPELHDACRVDRRCRPTHARVVQACRMLQERGIRPDLLCVVHSGNAGQPLAVYRHLRDLAPRSLTFLPLVQKTAAGTASAASVSGEDWGAFLCGIFGEWACNDVGRVDVQMFDEAMRPLIGMEHSLCVLRPSCGELPVLEHNGDFYSCDHFVDRRHFLGNIREVSLAQVLASARQRAFGSSKRDKLPHRCRGCRWLAFCNGGCPKDRIVQSSAGGPPENHLCAGYRRFFSHARPALQRVAAFVQAGQPVNRFSAMLRQERARSGAGRNQPCPCGSGKKFKKCCLTKPR